MVMQSRKYRLCRCLGYNINSCIRADIQLAVPAYKAALKVIMASFTAALNQQPHFTAAAVSLNHKELSCPAAVNSSEQAPMALSVPPAALMRH